MNLTWEPREPGRGRIALLHGVMSLAQTWWRVGPALADHGWRVLALDLPGHGDGPALTGPLTLSALVEGTAKQLSEPVDVLVGHSLGAITAAAMAGLYPALARALVLEEPPATELAGDQAIADSIAHDAALVQASRDRLERRERRANPRWLPGDIERSVDGIAAADAGAIVAGMRGPLQWDLPALLAAVDMPVLVLAAPAGPGQFALTGGSALKGPDRAWAESTLPGGRFMVLRGGHCLHRDQPGDWVRAVRTFAASALPG